MSENQHIAVAYGDGIGPEIMEAVLLILKEAGAKLQIHTIEIGEKPYTKGFLSGISNEAMETVKKCKVLLKAPITTPQGKGYKSLNVTFRKSLGLYANVRPVASYHPYIFSHHPDLNLVVVRENKEDLYSGIEYRPSSNACLSSKLITRQGSEKIIRYAFEYATQNGRRKVTCVSKDNIMKIADGMFHVIFDEIAKEYPNLKTEHYIVDIGAARVASKPETFDVIVTLNLYGDIISDIAAEISGSVGLAGSMNIGQKYSMFEAVHGSAPDIAGQGIANPSGLCHAAILMLEYLGQSEIAAKIHNAWLKTIESGFKTADVYRGEGQKVSTKEFTAAVIANLGQSPEKIKKVTPVKYIDLKACSTPLTSQQQDIIGVDIYISHHTPHLSEIVAFAEKLSPKFELQHIAARGIKVWPGTDAEVEAEDMDLWRLRYIANDKAVTQGDILELQGLLINQNIHVTMTNTLYTYDGMAGFTKAQGE